MGTNVLNVLTSMNGYFYEVQYTVTTLSYTGHIYEQIIPYFVVLYLPI